MILFFHKDKPPLVRYGYTLLIAIIILIAISYNWLDRPIALFFMNSPQTLRIAAQYISDLFTPQVHYFLWALAFFFAAQFKRSRSWKEPLLLMVVSVPLANLGAALLKNCFSRARPELFLSQDIWGFFYDDRSNAYLSFPSSHACTIGVCMGALACFYPKLSWLFVVAGVLLAGVRLILEQHYLSDTLAGLTLGITAVTIAHTRIRLLR
jgi:membrane-associated phospholipid phosphatase